MNKNQKFFLSFAILQVVLFLFGAFCMSYTIMIAYKTDAFLENILPLIYLALHFAIIAFAFIMSIKAMKHGSLVFNTLCFDEGGLNITGPKVFSGVVGVGGLTLFIYFLLALIGVKVPGYQFSIGLIVDLTYVGISLFIGALYFFIYPFVFEYQAKAINKN